MITITSRGDFKRTELWLSRLGRGDFYKSVKANAQKGVDALARNTPVESGATAASWGYDIKHSLSSVTITWTNGNVQKGVPIAIILQYGHGTGTGGYVQGRDYINPAIKPVFDEIANAVWKDVTSL